MVWKYEMRGGRVRGIPEERIHGDGGRAMDRRRSNGRGGIAHYEVWAVVKGDKCLVYVKSECSAYADVMSVMLSL